LCFFCGAGGAHFACNSVAYSVSLFSPALSFPLLRTKKYDVLLLLLWAHHQP
jgi:hypothetical protein